MTQPTLLSRCVRHFIFIATILSLLATTAPYTPAYAGEAGKSIVQTGAQQPDTQVTVKLQLAKPNVPVTPSVELVIVVDTSGSLANEISSMKSKLNTFVTNTLSQYPGAVRVGITKIGNGTAAFDSNNANNPGQNAAMYPAGSTLSAYTNVRRANSAVGIDKVVTITSSNLSQLTSAINNINVEPTGNTTSYNGGLEQRNGQNSYTSDIGPGMESGAGMFTSDNNAKFMLLLTDGLANKGYCPISTNGNIKVPNWISGTQFQVLSSASTTLRVGDPDGSYNSYVPQENGYPADANFPSSYPNPFGEPGVCYPYIHNKFSATGLMADNVSPHYASSLPQNSILDQIASVYSGTKSSDIQLTFNKVIDKAKMAAITITDTLNPNVFASIDSYQYLANCDSGNHYASSSTLTISGTTFTFIIQNQATITALTNICVYFLATIASNPPPNDQPINTNSGSNTVLYQNGYGVTQATDTIALGTITIAGGVANLRPTNFALADVNGNPKSIFTVGENIYFLSTVANVGTAAVTAGAITRYYANQSATVGPAQDPPTPVACVTHGATSAGLSYDYNSYPGGTGSSKLSTTAPCGLSWSQSTVGNYTARIDVNYQQASGGSAESDYSDNQATAPYAVITMPTGLNVCVDASNVAYFSWTGGAGITSYKIHNKNLSKGTEGYNTTSGTTYSIALQSGTQNYQVSLIPQVVVGGTLTDGPETAPVSYTTGSNTCNVATWFQVAGPTTDVSYKGAAGDVFSNGPIGTVTLPSNPIQKYFFNAPTPGTIVANNTISISPVSAVVASTNSPWLAATYPKSNTPQKTSTYSSLYTTAKSSRTLTELAGQSTLFTGTTCNGGTSAIYHVAGDALLNSQDITLTAATCDNTNLIYFIDGNLQVSHQFIDQTNSGTFTFVVKGNISVDPAVTQMDGVYVFGGRFSDGTTGGNDNPLAIHGSLLGLSGNVPSASTGSFTMANGQSGLQRNLGAATNPSTPAELVYFQPKYLYLLQSSALSTSTFNWTE